MKCAVSENGLVVLNYLKSIGDVNVTSADIAEATGLSTKTVDGVVTAGLIRNRNFVERVEAEIELEDGKHKSVKFIKLLDAGKNYDHESAVAKDEAAKEAEKAAKAAAKDEQ